MSRKKILERRQKRLEEKRSKLLKRSQESQDVEEVRAINEQLTEIAEDLRDIADELETLKDDGGDGSGGSDGGDGSGGSDGSRGDDPDGGNGRSQIPEGAQARGGNPMQAYGGVRGSFVQNTGGQVQEVDPYDTEEYRTAFMEFVCRGVPIPENMRGEIPREFREAQVTLTSDASAVIPTSIMNEIIRQMDSHGNAWAKARKLSVQGGVKIPILALKPTATWIDEDKVSDTQKVSSTESVSFSYYGLECRIAQSILANVTTLKMFQNLFTTLATEAMITACEIAMFNGDGDGKLTGITTDSRITAANKIKLKASEITQWTVWKKKVFAKMKKAYRKGEFWMNQATFDGYIDGMVDANGQPIGRVNYGIDGGETYRFGGKNVETVDDDILKDYDTAANNEVFGVFIDMNNYVVNTNMQMVTVRWTDHDTNQIKDKCLMIVDGKLADVNGVLLLVKDTTADSQGTGGGVGA